MCSAPLHRKALTMEENVKISKHVYEKPAYHTVNSSVVGA